MRHEIIKTDNYLLVVDESEIKEGDLVFNEYQKQTYTFNAGSGVGLCKKIIAHLPLNGSPILEGVDLLPPLEDDAICPYPESKQNAVDWHNGYLKAKEKYKYTEEDLRRAWNAAYIDAMSIDEETYKPLFYEDFIQSLSQPKTPTGFECAMKSIPCPDNKPGCIVCHMGIMTTTTAEGHTQWVGSYIYE